MHVILSVMQSLYLEGNRITKLPEDFFQKLPSLKWLDIRNNELVCLPSAYIGSHKNLTHLLVQGNELQALPLELGKAAEHIFYCLYTALCIYLVV